MTFPCFKAASNVVDSISTYTILVPFLYVICSSETQLENADSQVFLNYHRSSSNLFLVYLTDRLCVLVVRVPDYRSRGPGFDPRGYQIFWEIVGLERGPRSLVSTTEELFGRNSSGSGLKNREYGRGDPLRSPRDTPLSAKVGTNFTDMRRWLGRNKTTGFYNEHSL
jgi:hypothetical protein